MFDFTSGYRRRDACATRGRRDACATRARAGNHIRDRFATGRTAPTGVLCHCLWIVAATEKSVLGLPPGTLRLTAWHNSFQMLTKNFCDQISVRSVLSVSHLGRDGGWLDVGLFILCSLAQGTIVNDGWVTGLRFVAIVEFELIVSRCRFLVGCVAHNLF